MKVYARQSNDKRSTYINFMLDVSSSLSLSV